MMNNSKQINIQYYDSPCGRLVLASFADSLCLCDWSDNPFAERNMRRLTRGMNVSFKTETTSALEETKRQLDYYLAAQDFAEDNDLFIEGRNAIQGYLGVSDEYVESILSKCVAD